MYNSELKIIAYTVFGTLSVLRINFIELPVANFFEYKEVRDHIISSF